MPLPERVESAVRAIGTVEARAAIVRHLAEEGPSTSGDLSQAIGSPPNNCRDHLRVLEQAGIVVADEPPGMRAGRRVRYQLHRKALEASLREYAAFLLADDTRQADPLD